jgi:hypothetical protein
MNGIRIFRGFQVVRAGYFCNGGSALPGATLGGVNLRFAAQYVNSGFIGWNMRIHKTLSAFFMVALIAVLVGCGSSKPVGSGQTPPPVTGSFTNASLNGSYAFLIRGSNAGFYSVAGSFQANGSGMITAGVEDINSPGTGVLANNVAISGTYTVQADGRTTANLNSASGNFAIDFVLISNQHGLAIRFNNSATGAGTIDLQQTSAFSTAAIAGSYSFSLYGGDHNGNFETTAGAFTTTVINNTDAIQLGVQDYNDNGALSVNRSLTGALTAPTTGRGTATLTTNVASLNFAYYIVDATHLILIETDSAPTLAGNAFSSQSGPVLTGTVVLEMSGASGNLAFAAGAILNTDGVSSVLTTSTEDFNKGGTVTPNLPISGTFSTLLNGRGTITMPGSSGLASLVCYPSSGGILLMSVDSSAVATGTAISQSISTPSNASLHNIFAFSLAGANGAGAVDAIAQFTADGNGNITGNLDENSVGTLGSAMALTGTYSLSAIGRGTAVFNSAAGTMNLIFYMVDASDFIYVEADTGQVATGRFLIQQ